MLLVLALAVSVLADDPHATAPMSLCASSAPGGPACNVPKKDLKKAKAAFARGVKLQNSKHLDEALEQFETAARLVPQDVEFATARELIRQQVVYEHLQSGNTALLKGKQVEALAEFRSALQLDPENQFARQRLTDALGESAPRISGPTQVVAAAGEIELNPQPVYADFHYRGDSRELLAQLAKTYGVTGVTDDSVVSRPVRFDIQDVDFYTAVRAACDVTKTFWTPLDEKQLLFAAETQENHRQFDRMGARTFYISGATSPQDLTEVVNALRTLFEIRFVSQQPNASTVTVRAPQRVLDAATQFLEGLDASRPQVVLDLKLYQISHTMTRNMGVHIPDQFQLFNIPASALAALGGSNIQDLINQLIASGGINQANSTAISALLAQLQGQQNSIFSQPLATFGGGMTLMGVSLDHLSAALSLNESSVTSLDHVTLRADQGKDATFRSGSRYPILNASFAPIYNSTAISKVIGNNSFVPAFPSFSYEDLGLTVKAKPQVHGGTDVSLTLEIQVRSLGGASLNGVPVINNREYKGAITVKDGEPAVVAGSMSQTEQRSLSGIPGLGQVPGLNKIMTTNTKEEDDDELLVVVTPHVVSGTSSGPASEIWMTAK